MRIQPTGVVARVSADASESPSTPAPSPQRIREKVQTAQPAPTSTRPNCAAALSIPIELYGKNIRCTVCQTVLTASENGSQCFAAATASKNNELVRDLSVNHTGTAPQISAYDPSSPSTATPEGFCTRFWRVTVAKLARVAVVCIVAAVIGFALLAKNIRARSECIESYKALDSAISGSTVYKKSIGDHLQGTPKRHDSRSSAPQYEVIVWRGLIKNYRIVLLIENGTGDMDMVKLVKLDA